MDGSAISAYSSARCLLIVILAAIISALVNDLVLETYCSGLTPNHSAINLGVTPAVDLYVLGILNFGSLSNSAIASSTLVNLSCLDKIFLETFSVPFLPTSPVLSEGSTICLALSESILVLSGLLASICLALSNISACLLRSTDPRYVVTFAVSALKSAIRALALPGKIPCSCSVTAVLTASIEILPVGLNFKPLLITGQFDSTIASIAPNLSTAFDDGEFIMSTKPSFVIKPSLTKPTYSVPLGDIPLDVFVGPVISLPALPNA